MPQSKFARELAWEEGQLLFPEHFSHLTAFLREDTSTKANHFPFPWGVYLLESEIVGDVLNVTQFSLVLPDESFTNITNENSVVHPFPLPDPNATEKNELIICWSWQNESPSETTYEGNLGYKKWKFYLLEQAQLNNTYQFFPAIKLLKVEKTTNQFVWQKDETFLPPLFKISKNQKYLYGLLTKIIAKLKYSVLNFSQSEANEYDPRFQILYQCLAEGLPYEGVLWDISPYLLYMSWIRMVGYLKGVLEISSERKIDFPGYDHLHLSETFGKLYSMLDNYLETIVLSKYKERKFAKNDAQYQFRVKLAPNRDYYILATMKGQAALQLQWLENATISYEKDIASLVQGMRKGPFMLEKTVNEDITKYRPGILYKLKERTLGAMGDPNEKILVIAGSSVLGGNPSMLPEKLILLFEIS